MTVLTYSRVPPFGHLWIKACFQLPEAFRRIPRPSSPLTAKASTVCASLLDHITSITSKLYAHTYQTILSSLVLPHFFTKFLMNVWIYQIKILSVKVL